MNAVLGTRATVARDAIAALMGSSLDPLELLEEVRSRIARVVPHDTGAWMLTDPQTVMPISGIRDRPLGPDYLQRACEHEVFVADFMTFARLHRAGVVATTLMRATDGRPELSPGYREVHQPAGLGPELRLLFRTGAATWAMACVHRAAGEPEFDDDELAWLRTIAPEAGRALRAAIARPPAEPQAAWAPGMLVLDDHGAVEYTTGAADAWLEEIPRTEGFGLPAVVATVALQARAEALAAAPAYEAPAQARVRLDSGIWLYVHAAALRDASGVPTHTAVVFEPADRSQLLPLLAEVHGLSEREREVTQMLLAGLPIDQIARHLSISRHTVRDHCKAIFAKLDVASRPELTARFLADVR
jgi:DNA-binding CsgD family transcriptional regulator